METTATLDSSRGKTIAWAAFLGASWTWVIGMYLPVLLVSEFGLWGWIVFALPNVIGAAAMGAVLLNADRSRKLLAQHSVMATAFSIVTIAFHVFFVGWMLVYVVGLYESTATLVIAGMLFIIGGARRDLWLAIAALLISVVCLVLLLTQPLRHSELIWRADPRPELLALTPVCMFGFFLCPYLDLTFHRARQALEPKAGIRAFQLGFGVFFFLMIIFTLLYARWLDEGVVGVNNRLMHWAVGVHMIVQIAFTLAVHTRAVLGGTKEVRGSVVWLILAVVAALGLAVFSQQQALAGKYFRAIDGSYRWGEMVYRCFIGFYGLIFPAYVWLCMIPKGRPTAPDAGRWGRFVLAVVVAMPFYYLGFIERRYWWLLVGLGIVLAMRWTIPARNPKSEIRINDE